MVTLRRELGLVAATAAALPAIDQATGVPGRAFSFPVAAVTIWVAWTCTVGRFAPAARNSAAP